ncbi:methyltransferase family protein [Planctomycetota bacterium]
MVKTKINKTIEWFLKSFVFSLILSLYVAFAAVRRGRSLLASYETIELLRLIYAVTASILFLIRSRPTKVDTNPWHWAVAFFTSFAAHFFIRVETETPFVIVPLVYVLLVIWFLVGSAAVLTLGRSFGFLPALRRVKTGWIYRYVRHPMYLSAMLFKLAYVLQNPSLYNTALFVCVVFLYDRRAGYEEALLLYDEDYVSYRTDVQYRFIPGLY